MPHTAASYRRHVADALSLSNLACGVAAGAFAIAERFELALLLVITGAVFDGLDGAAARRFGGTRIGVLADDCADAVTYGIAPAIAIWSVYRSPEGVVLGVAYALFTFARLLHFTLSKDAADPNYFAGVPSTFAGMGVLCSVLVFGDHPIALGALVGVLMIKMVAFGEHHRHFGRWFVSLGSLERWLAIGAIAALVPLLVFEPRLFASVGIVVVLGSALRPTVASIASHAKQFSRAKRLG